MTALRIEHDAFGPVSIPADRYWGAQTQRALEVFGSKQPFPASLIRAFGGCGGYRRPKASGWPIWKPLKARRMSGWWWMRRT